MSTQIPVLSPVHLGHDAAFLVFPETEAEVSKASLVFAGDRLATKYRRLQFRDYDPSI